MKDRSLEKNQLLLKATISTTLVEVIIKVRWLNDYVCLGSKNILTPCYQQQSLFRTTLTQTYKPHDQC